MIINPEVVIRTLGQFNFVCFEVLTCKRNFGSSLLDGRKGGSIRIPHELRQMWRLFLESLTITHLTQTSLPDSDCYSFSCVGQLRVGGLLSARHKYRP